MSQPAHNSSNVRRVVLPSGRAIEVVYFDGRPATPAPAAAGASRAQTGLHVCPDCRRPLVHPVDWEEASDTDWRVHLRCPNCGWQTIGIFDQATMDRFDEQLDAGTAALLQDLKRLTRANMEEEVERFGAALASDAIWPMDF
jgi:hypothetical protein